MVMVIRRNTPTQEKLAIPLVRAVRIRRVNGHASSCLHNMRLLVNGVDVVRRGTLAPDAIFASNADSGYPPTAAVDNNDGTYWFSSATTPWIAYVFGDPVALGQVDLLASSASGYNYLTGRVIETSTDTTDGRNGTWTVRKTINSSTINAWNSFAL